VTSSVPRADIGGLEGMISPSSYGYDQSSTVSN